MYEERENCCSQGQAQAGNWSPPSEQDHSMPGRPYGLINAERKSRCDRESRVVAGLTDLYAEKWTSTADPAGDDSKAGQFPEKCMSKFVDYDRGKEARSTAE